MTQMTKFVACWAVIACAWILWNNSDRIVDGVQETPTQRVVKATETLQDCEREAVAAPPQLVRNLTTLGDALQQPVPTMRVEGTTLTMMTKTNVTLVMFHCFPDTIDPRKP